MSLSQLVGTLHNLCKGRGSNPKHLTSPHLNVRALATRLLDKKKRVHLNKMTISFGKEKTTISVVFVNLIQLSVTLHYSM